MTQASPPVPVPTRKLLGAVRSRHWQAFAAFGIASALLLALHYRSAITDYPFDAKVYWTMATAPVPAEYAIRGYLFPWILGTFITIGSAVGFEAIHAFRIFSSIAYAGVLTLLLPATFSRFAPGEFSLARRLAPFILVAAVFPGLMLYPLSDLPAAVFMWLSVYCLFGCRRQVGRRRAAIALALLAGAAAGAAYNTRTIYLFAVVVAAAIAFRQFRGRREYLLYAALGFALICLPQVIINQQMHGVFSANPTVAYGKASHLAEKKSLSVEQLNAGIRLQKYETTISDGAVSPSVNYLDPAGQTLLTRICEEGPIETVLGYARAVLRHPAEFMGIYARHFINGLDVRDGRAYTRQSSATRTLASFGCITLLMLLLLAIRSGGTRDAGADRFGLPWDRMWPWVLVLPSLAILPAAMETRFMLPLMLYLFVAASAHWSRAAIASEIRPRWHFYLALALIVYAVFFGVTMSTMANLSQAPLPANAASCPGA